MQHFIQVPRLSHSIALFLSLENEVGRLFKLMQIMGEGGGGWLTTKGVSNQVGPFLNFPPPIFFFLQIAFTVEINLTAKKLFKIAIRKTSRTAGLAVCKSRISNFILPAEKYEKKRLNKQGYMTEAAVFQCFPAVWGYLGYVELMSLLNSLFYVVSGLLPCWSLWSSLSLVWSKCMGEL